MSVAGGEPDVVMGCAGDVPTLETLAAADILRTELPDLKVRVVNVVDLMRLQQPSEHPHGLSDAEFDMAMLNDIDRYHLVMDVIDRVPGLATPAAHLRQRVADQRMRARAYTREHGEDLPEIRDWTWDQRP